MTARIFTALADWWAATYKRPSWREAVDRLASSGTLRPEEFSALKEFFRKAAGKLDNRLEGVETRFGPIGPVQSVQLPRPSDRLEAVAQAILKKESGLKANLPNFAFPIYAGDLFNPDSYWIWHPDARDERGIPAWIAMSESKGMTKDPSFVDLNVMPISTAFGIFQFTSSTWKALEGAPPHLTCDARDQYFWPIRDMRRRFGGTPASELAQRMFLGHATYSYGASWDGPGTWDRAIEYGESKGGHTLEIILAARRHAQRFDEANPV